jgi:hypothetical protein
MTVRVTERSIFALLLLSVSLWGLPADALPQSVVSGHSRPLPRLPYRTRESTDMSGRLIFEVERVEVGVELAPDTFTLLPFTNWGRRK